MFPWGDAVQHFDDDTALEQVVQDDEPFEEVPAEAVDFLDGEHASGQYVRECLEEAGLVLGGEPAADLLFEDLPADGFERVVLPAGVLLVGAHSHQAAECHRVGSPFVHQTPRTGSPASQEAPGPLLPPSCPTRSISTNPGTASSH